MLLCAMVLSLACSSSATAGGLRSLLRKPAPKPRFYPVYVIPHDAHSQATGYAVPSYAWGYFGARRGPGPMGKTHGGYYNDYCEWDWGRR